MKQKTMNALKKLSTKLGRFVKKSLVALRPTCLSAVGSKGSDEVRYTKINVFHEELGSGGDQLIATYPVARRKLGFGVAGADASGRRSSTPPAYQPKLKPCLRTEPSSSGKMKRVTFTGIPELPRAWVPPHRREGFKSRFDEATRKNED